MKKRVAWILAATMAFAAIAGCSGGKQTDPDPGKQPDSKPAEKQELTINLGAEPPDLDSARTTDSVSFILLNATMEGLLRTGEGSKLLPGIATDLPKVENGVVYTFNLRKDAKWSDGKPVTSKDFKFSWMRALDPKTASEYGYQLYYIKGGEAWNTIDPKDAQFDQKYKELKEKVAIETPDDYTLKVTLERPTPYWMSLMSFPTYLPQREDIVTQHGDKYASAVDKLVFNGPFTVKEWVPDDHITMEKNPTYWDAKGVKLEKVNFRVITDASTAIQMYEAGELDEVGVPGEFIPKYKDQGMKTMADASTVYLIFNLNLKQFQNKKIRQAMNLALDRKGFADNVLKNGSIPARGYTPDSIAGDGGKTFRQISGELIKPNGDKEQAKKLWEEGLKELGVNKLSVKFLISDTSSTKRYAQGIQEMLQNALPGLTMEIEPVAFAVRLARARERNYEMVLWGWGADYNDPMTFMDMYVTKGSYNDADWSNAQYDEAIKKAQTDTNNANRMKYMAEAEKVMMEELPVLPLYHPAINWVEKPYVKGILNFPVGAGTEFKWAHIEGRAK